MSMGTTACSSLSFGTSGCPWERLRAVPFQLAPVGVHGKGCEQFPFSWHQWVSMGTTASSSLSVGTIVIENCMQQASTPTKSITLTALGEKHGEESLDSFKQCYYPTESTTLTTLGEKHREKNLDSFKRCYYPVKSITLTALEEKHIEESLNSFKRCYYYFSFMGLYRPGSILVLHV